jgi:hypothetical protein
MGGSKRGSFAFSFPRNFGVLSIFFLSSTIGSVSKLAWIYSKTTFTKENEKSKLG